MARRVFCFCSLALICSTALSDPLTEQPSPRLDSQRLLDDALEQARAEGKRVYVVESGDNCTACMLMARFFERYKSILDQDFIVLKIERRPDGIKNPVLSRIRAGKPGGIPWSAILDGNGTVLATSNDADGKNLGFPTDPAKIECFMKMLASTSRRITHNQLQGMTNSLLHHTILSEFLDERQNSSTEASRQDKVEAN